MELIYLPLTVLPMASGAGQPYHLARKGGTGTLCGIAGVRSLLHGIGALDAGSVCQACCKDLCREEPSYVGT